MPHSQSSIHLRVRGSVLIFAISACAAQVSKGFQNMYNVRLLGEGK